MSRDTEIQRFLRRRPHLLLAPRAVHAIAVDSPLIRLLESMPPRERLAWRGIRLHEDLGYLPAGTFETAAQLLRFLKPREWLVGGESTPAESRRLKAFQRPLTRADLRPHVLKAPVSTPPRATGAGR